MFGIYKFCVIFATALGQLAQLVQSTSFTPRGSGVRIPHCPHHSQSCRLFVRIFCFAKNEKLALSFFKNKKYAKSFALKDCICRSGFIGGSAIPHCPHHLQSCRFSSGFFVLQKKRSLLYHFFKTKNTQRAPLLRIVFAGVVSSGDL